MRRAAAAPMSAKATGKVSLAVMASRVLGLLREMMFAGLFGGSRWMDCFYLAFKVPNLLRDLFAEGALSQAFVTTFSKKLKSDGEESAWALANKMFTLAAVFMSAITLLGVWVAPWIVEALTALSRSGASPRNYNPDEIAFTVTMVRIMYPFILLVSLAALVMGLLNARHIFGMPALSSCFFNLGSMIGGLAFGWWLDPTWGKDSLTGFSIGVSRLFAALKLVGSPIVTAQPHVGPVIVLVLDRERLACDRVPVARADHGALFPASPTPHR